MSLPLTFIPEKPFPDFKWKWASLQCTEGLNDPVVLLGVLFRMRKLEMENKRLKYSSQAFGEELRSLSDAVKNRLTHKVDLARRVGERNIMRNSAQYWSALGLIPARNPGGVITLTDFGRKVADRKISQAEFAALTIQTLTLPNPNIQKKAECELWERHGLKFKPLMLILRILIALDDVDEGYITKKELLGIIIPLSGVATVTVSDYVSFIRAYRVGELDIRSWPVCYEGANDHRIATEFFLFLENYGYVSEERLGNDDRRFSLNQLIRDEVENLIYNEEHSQVDVLVNRLKENSSFVQEIERKRVQSSRMRPNQARFRRDVLGDRPRCVITNVTMPEILEAAHIVPFKYHGEDTKANGLAMRMDIHQLFDSGHLRIHENGGVFLTDRARMDYGALIPPQIHIPDYVNKEFVRWRWANYNGI